MNRVVAPLVLVTLLASAGAAFGQAPGADPDAVEPGDAPRHLPTPIRSVWATPGFRQRPSAAPRMPFDYAYPYRQPGPAVLARHGAVSCVSPIASQVGVEVLKRGGSAADAAIAVAFALAVVYPEAGNLGGGGFAIWRGAGANGAAEALDYRETAPAAATAGMFLDRVGNVTPASVIGHLASGVPGTVAGMAALHKRHGRRPWAELLTPAIRLAREGFIVSPYLAKSMHRAQDLMMRFDETRRVFMPHGITPRAGAAFRQPDLAQTLTRIANAGADGFYKGQTAALIAQEMRANGGLITQADLAGYQAKWREPLRFTYRGYTIETMPLPSSGGVTMAQVLNILEGYDLKAMGWHTARHAHYMLEAERRAYTDRNVYLGDPDFAPGQPVATLISKAYAAKRRQDIRPDHATPEAGRRPGLAEPDHTTHFSVVDAQGNAVSSTYTLNGNYGSGVTIPGTGVLMNNEMDDFTAKAGTPNMFGLVQGPKNAIAPRKRPLSSMTPSVVLDPGGRLFMVIGAPGGSTIITTVMQVISNVVDFGHRLNWAISAPRLHHQAVPDILYHEPMGLDPTTRDELVRMGHQCQVREPIGDAQGILRRPDGAWEAYADPRRGGEAFGY